MYRPIALLFVLMMPVAAIAGEAPPLTPKPTVVNPASKPFLGVNVDENGASFDPNQGLPVTTVIPGSTAAVMGIEVGDLLLTFNGAKLTSQNELKVALGKIKVGDEVTLEVTRKNVDLLVKKTFKGLITVRPQVASITADLARLREETLALRKLQEERKAKELSLADMLTMLKEIEEQMPAAVAEFKKQYPRGEFNIQIKIDIVSDKTAKTPITVGNQPDAALNPGNANAPVDSKEQKEPKDKSRP
jgi:membrane-associated protease RseP (regulator of RpoE activity)